MTDHEPRLFADDGAIRRVGEAMIARKLPREEWTHEAHLATCAWIILERPDIVPERDLPDLIRRYNESLGGVNDATQGYHETITQVFIRAVRSSLGRSEGRGLAERVNLLLRSPEGRRDWPLRFYSRERLFSAEARLGWAAPDRAPLPPIVSAAEAATSSQRKPRPQDQKTRSLCLLQENDLMEPAAVRRQTARLIGLSRVTDER